MFHRKKKKNPAKVAILGGIGFVLGMGAVFLLGTERGKKYRNQLGELTADFFDTIADGCREIKNNLSS
ncbi:MAG: hypothetical protein ACE5HI_04885 [bacterium]